MSITTDELRQVAQVYRNLGKYATEKMLLDAADTICELQDENARLRERIDATHMSRLLTENENESLRELAAKMAEALRVGGEWCDRECIVVFGCDGMDECPIAKELRELGVEVDG